MRRFSFIGGVCAALAVAFVAPSSAAPPWPSAPITLVTPAPPGGAIDLTARIVADGLAVQLGQTVRVDPRPGADGILAAQAFLSANNPDHTFLVTFGGLLVSNPVTHDKLPYDVSSDFVPVVMLATDTIVICAAAEFPVESLGDLVREMRARPDAVRWSSAPGEPKLRFLGLLKQIEARPLFVPYKSLNQAVIDLSAGRIEVVVAPLAAVRPQLQSGKLRLLATMAAERSPAAPNVPSVAEAGYPRLVMIPFIGLFARSGTPPEIAARLGREIGTILFNPAAEQALRNAGLKPIGGSPQALGAVVGEKLRENRELAREVGPGWQ